MSEARLERLELRAEVEDFFAHEASLLDTWQLDEWLSLWDDPCRYEVAPTAIDDPLAASADTTLFLIADDRYRLEQRIIRIKKTSAHVEYPHSKTRHLYANIRLVTVTDEQIEASLGFVTFRTKRAITTSYMGRADYKLKRTATGFLIISKRIGLDLDSLVPQGKVSIFL